MNEFDDFIGKLKRLQQAGKEANLVLNTLAGNAWATLCHKSKLGYEPLGGKVFVNIVFNRFVKQFILNFKLLFL